MAAKLHSWFMNANVHSQANMRLFCFPYAGGGASIYRDWPNLFPKDMEVCAVQLPGRENRGMEAPINSLTGIVQAVADEIQPLLNAPFAFFGHSMGALLAYETARYLGKKYNKIPTHLFVSGRSAPQLTRSNSKLYLLPDDELIQQLRILKGTPEAILENDELMELLLPRLRADFEVCETYTFSQDEPIACPITAFGGMADDEVGMESLAAWKELTRNESELLMLEGDHFFLHEEQERIAEKINGSLSKTPVIHHAY